MIKDLFFTLASFVLVFCGLLYWNHFWREYLTAKVHYKTGNVVLAIEHYSKALSESSRGIIKEAEQSLRQEILAMTGEFDWKNSNAFLKALAIMTKDKSSDHSQTISEANQLLYDLIIEYSINKDGVGLELLSKVLFQANPNLSLAFLAQGEGDLLRGNLSQAVKAYESCLEREPFFERGVINLVEIYHKDEQYRDIIRVAEPNILKVKPSFKFLSALGKAYFFDKQLSKAVTPLEDSLAIKPKNFPNLVLLGRIGLALDEPKLVDNLEIAWSHDKTRLDELEKWLKFQLEIENFQRVIDRKSNV